MNFAGYGCRPSVRYPVSLSVKSKSALIPHPERRTILRPRFAPVIEPRCRDIRVAKPLLDLGDVGLMREGIGRRRGAQ
jgi:hypothetical protein